MRAIGESSLRARKWGVTETEVAGVVRAGQTVSSMVVSSPGPTASQKNDVDSHPGISDGQWGPRRIVDEILGGKVFWSQCLWIYAR